MMKRSLAIVSMVMLTVLLLGQAATCATEPIVFKDQDFTSLRSGFLKDRGGIESIGAYAEDHFRYWGGDGLLSCGDGYYVGYITYKVSAPSGQTIRTLKLDLVGRIGAYDDGGNTAAQWIQKNWMRIYVFKDAYAFDRLKWQDYESKVAVIPELTENPPSSSEMYSFDLSQKAAGGKDVYVTIATYEEWTPDWIGFSHLTLSGTTAASSSTPAPTATVAPTGNMPTEAAPTMTSAPTPDETTPTALEATPTVSVTPTSTISPTDAPDETDKTDDGNIGWIVAIALLAAAAIAGGIILAIRRRKNART